MQDRKVNRFTFVSYARADIGAIEPILRFIGGRGIDLWYDKGIPAGADFVEMIFGKIKEAENVLVFWTPSAASSKFVKREMYYADELGKLVPIQINGTALHPYYLTLNWIPLKLSQLKGDEDGLGKIIAVLSAARGVVVSSPRSKVRLMVLFTVMEQIVREINGRVAIEGGIERFVNFITSAMLDDQLVRSIHLDFSKGGALIASANFEFDWRRMTLAGNGNRLSIGDATSLSDTVKNIVRTLNSVADQKKIDAFSWWCTMREAPELQAKINELKVRLGLIDRDPPDFDV